MSAPSAPPEKLGALISLLAAQPDEDVLRRAAQAVARGAEEHELARLADVIGTSGASLPPGRHRGDVASTGGMGSLSTLIGPAMLRAAGFEVAAIGVVGRPAGAVDVLGQLPNYRLHLDAAAASSAMASAGYIHLEAGHFAPLDARLFGLRRRAEVPDHPDLALVSLLAKKVAGGVTRLGLDVRIHRDGAFGATVSGATRCSRRFIRIARLLGIHTICFLTDGSRLAQPYLGRGEALAGVNAAIFEEAALLRSHVEHIARMASAVASVSDGAIPLNRVREAFVANLAAQGSSESEFRSIAKRSEEAPRREITVARGGYARLRVSVIREALVAAQARSPGIWPDPGGVIVRMVDGSEVVAGAPVVGIREPSPGSIALATAVSVSSHRPPPPRPMIVVGSV